MKNRLHGLPGQLCGNPWSYHPKEHPRSTAQHYWVPQRAALRRHTSNGVSNTSSRPRNNWTWAAPLEAETGAQLTSAPRPISTTRRPQLRTVWGVPTASDHHLTSQKKSTWTNSYEKWTKYIGLSSPNCKWTNWYEKIPVGDRPPALGLASSTEVLGLMILLSERGIVPRRDFFPRSWPAEVVPPRKSD